MRCVKDMERPRVSYIKRDESMTIPQSFSMQDNEYESDDEGEYDYCLGHPHLLSGMFMCTKNSAVYDDDGDSTNTGNYSHLDDDYCDTISMHLSQLSTESFHYGDADGHYDFTVEGRECKDISGRGSSDYDLESMGDSHSSTVTPPQPQWRNQSADLDLVLRLQQEKHKEYYTSKNKAKMMMDTMKGNRGRLERATSFGDPNSEQIAADNEAMIDSSSDDGGSGDVVDTSVVIKTRPRGVRRSLCMDLEEVKACRDLGFDLEHDDCTTLRSSSSSASGVVIPSPTITGLSCENSTLDTSSGTDSPISKWRISSPGDDPRDVKARLRVWAQAVALASTSRHCC